MSLGWRASTQTEDRGPAKRGGGRAGDSELELSTPFPCLAPSSLAHPAGGTVAMWKLGWAEAAVAGSQPSR